MSKAVGMPREFVSQMRNVTWWPAQEAVAHTLVYEAHLMGDFSLPTQNLASVTLPTFVIDGGETLWLSQTAQAVADALPHAQRQTLKGEPHNVDPSASAPVLKSFSRRGQTCKT